MPTGKTLDYINVVLGNYFRKPLIKTIMKRDFFYFISLITILTITSSCGTTAQLYRYNDKNKKYSGQLSDSTYKALKHFLTSTTNSKLKDTIVIKYNYNNETCWNTLDQREDEHIMGFVLRHKQMVQQVLATRQNISFFDFREPGEKVNKIIKWDNSIIIDSTKQLFNLVFKERCICGSSIIVMPDKKFVYLRSDSHTEILDLTENRIEEILKMK
jgi:hypothetical protein